MAQVTYPGVYIDEFKPRRPHRRRRDEYRCISRPGGERPDHGGKTDRALGRVPCDVRRRRRDAPAGPVLPLVRRARLLRERRQPLLRRTRLECRLRRSRLQGSCHRRPGSSRRHGGRGDDRDSRTPRGPQAAPITVQVTNSDILSGIASRLFSAATNISGSGTNYVTVSDRSEARRFTRGDEIVWSATEPNVLVDRVEEDTVYLQADLPPGQSHWEASDWPISPQAHRGPSGWRKAVPVSGPAVSWSCRGRRWPTRRSGASSRACSRCVWGRIRPTGSRCARSCRKTCRQGRP